MSGNYYYLSLVNAETGEISGVANSSSPSSIVTSSTLIAVPAIDLSGVDPAGINRTHYYKDGGLVGYPPCPSEFHNFDFVAMAWVGDPERAWQDVRIQRDQCLEATDWMVTKAIDTGQPMPTGCASYRQGLRDVTQQSDPWAIVWPEIPA